MGWTYDHFISLYVNHRYAKVKEYAPEPTLETIGKIRAAYEADGCTYPGDIEGTREYYRDALLQAADGATVSYQFGNCRFDCKKNDKGTWDVHAYDTDGEDTTFEDRTASFFGGMFNDLFGTWGSGNLPDPDRIESRKRTIIARAKQDKQAWHYYKGYEVRVRKAYTNDSSDPESWTYCVSWYADGQLVECENGVRLEQAARALNDLPQWAEARKAA